MTTTAELLHFAILDITQIYTPDAVIIIVSTNNPCHLTLYHTETPPRRHKTSRILRGTAMLAGAYWCFDAWKSIEQQEEEDTFIHKFIIPGWSLCQTRWFTFKGTTVTPAPYSPENWPIYEPWGDTLTKNYPWLLYKPPDIPEYTLENGILTLTNPGYADCGLAYSPPYLLLPIVDNYSRPLRIAVDNPDSSTNSSSTQIHHELIFRSLTEVLSIYLAISLGAEWYYYKPQYHTVIKGRDCGIYWIDIGYHDLDLYQLFVKFRTEFGKSTDPTGWWLNDIVFVMSLGEEHRTDYLKSDYIGFYHDHSPQTPTNAHKEASSPSAGPIFKKHHPGATPEEKFEFYEDPKQTYDNIFEPYRTAQTFTPLQVHLLTKVYTLMSRAPRTYPNLYLEIKEAPDDIPTGPILSSGQTTWAVIPVSPTAAWIETPMTPLIAQPNNKYAIIAHTAGIGAGILRWWIRYYNVTYPRGILLWSSDAGETWSKFPTQDCLFQEWGIPPKGET